MYQDEFVYWLEHKFSNRQPGADIWYSLDNEPDLWSETHSRIHPKKLTYAELLDKTVTMSKAIKAVAPKTLIFGPASYGWGGYMTLQGAPDGITASRASWRFLSSWHEGSSRARERRSDLLDSCSICTGTWKPKATTNASPNKARHSGLAKARMQSTRSLWDPTYVEDSWITQSLGGKPIDLLHRVKTMIAKNYPGTKLAFTEYQYGGGADISGAIAQADALGIFGREGSVRRRALAVGGQCVVYPRSLRRLSKL